MRKPSSAYTLPLAIATGTALYLLFANVRALESAANVLGPCCETALPISIFLTLLVTFSKVDFHLMRLRRWHLSILAMQLLLVLMLMGLQLLSMSQLHLHSLAYVLEAVLVCVIAPCATASPVVTAKLGGDLTQMTTFVLLSSMVASLLIPLVFPLLEQIIACGTTSMTFVFQTETFLAILRRLSVVLMLPLLLGAVVRHWIGWLRRWIINNPDLGFYLWSFSLSITAGITVRNIVHSAASVGLLTGIAVLSGMTAVCQFGIGRKIGDKFGATICAGQGMFQKNTALAIWIAYTYLTPVASIGAGCYVLWQNLVNSVELWLHKRYAQHPEKEA